MKLITVENALCAIHFGIIKTNAKHYLLVLSDRCMNVCHLVIGFHFHQAVFFLSFSSVSVWNMDLPYHVWPVLSGLVSVPVLCNSWLAMSDIRGTPQPG